MEAWSSRPEEQLLLSGESRTCEEKRNTQSGTEHVWAVAGQSGRGLWICHRLSPEPACASGDSWHLTWWSSGGSKDPEGELEWSRSPFSWNEHKLCCKSASASSCCFICLCLSSCSQVLLLITLKERKWFQVCRNLIRNSVLSLVWISSDIYLIVTEPQMRRKSSLRRQSVFPCLCCLSDSWWTPACVTWLWYLHGRTRLHSVHSFAG